MVFTSALLGFLVLFFLCRWLRCVVLYTLLLFLRCGGSALSEFRVSGFTCWFCSASAFTRYSFPCFVFLPLCLLLFTCWASLPGVLVSVFAYRLLRSFLATSRCPIWLLASPFRFLLPPFLLFFVWFRFPFSAFSCLPSCASWSVCRYLRFSSVGSSSPFGSFALAAGFAISLASPPGCFYCLVTCFAFPRIFSPGLGPVFSSSSCSLVLSLILCSSFLLCFGPLLSIFFYLFFQLFLGCLSFVFWTSLEACPCCSRSASFLQHPLQVLRTISFDPLLVCSLLLLS